MAINKDVVLATGILTVCVVVLAVAFSGPEPMPGPGGGAAGLATDDDPYQETPDQPALPPDEPGQPIDISDILGADNETSIPLGEPELPGDDFTDDSFVTDDEPGIPLADNRPRPGTESSEGFNIFSALREEDPLAGYRPGERPETPAAPSGRPPVETTRPSRPGGEASETERPAAAGSTYVVESGDSLGVISMKVYGTSRRWREIQAANDIADPAALMVGQRLQIPGGRSTPPRQETSAAPSASGDGRSYTVRKGDSFYIIAQRELGDASRWREIQDLNDMDPHDLMAGQTIRLPERGRRALGSAIASAAGDDDEAPAGARIHVVGKGEVLGTISQRYYGTARRWREIAEANDISDPASLAAGQKLVIPRLAGVSPRSTGQQSSAGEQQRRSAASAGDGRSYAIQAGDTLAKIAQRFYGEEQAFRRILEGNPGLNPRRLAVGQRIVLPGIDSDATQPDQDDGALRLQEMLRQATAD